MVQVGPGQPGLDRTATSTSGATTPPKDTQAEPTFPDQETSVWTFDEQAGQYYLHRFYKHQPDLNVTNPLVRDEIAKIMGFWLQLGLSGFRVDAVPFFLETIGRAGGDVALPDPHDYLRDLRALLGRRVGRRDPARRGEPAPRGPAAVLRRRRRATSCTCSSTSSGCRRCTCRWPGRTPRPLADALPARPQPQPDCQWATFVRNHDELTLDKLSDDERQEVFAAFGPEQEMQVYGRGLIRRLPPMLDGDPRRIRMVYSLLFSLPGTPVLFYGEEIGMGENLDAGDRLAVRTPMQWTSERNGGFSNAPRDRLPGQPPEGGVAPEFVNVADQQRDPDSLLNFIRRLASATASARSSAGARSRCSSSRTPAVLAHRCTWDDGVARRRAQPVRRSGDRAADAGPTCPARCWPTC